MNTPDKACQPDGYNCISSMFVDVCRYTDKHTGKATPRRSMQSGLGVAVVQPCMRMCIFFHVIYNMHAAWWNTGACPSVFSRTTVVISKAKQDHSCFAFRHRMLTSACLCQPSCCMMGEASWSHGNRSFASANATPPSTNLSLQISRKTTLSARKQRAKHPPRSKHRPDLCKMKDSFHRQRAFTVCLQVFNNVEAFVQLGRKDDNFTRCDAWCQSKDICNCKFHASWMWFTLTHVILHHCNIFYPCTKTTVVNPQQKVGGSMCRTFSAAWRPGVFVAISVFIVCRMPQIPKVGWMICKRMELWSSKMSSARKRSRSAGAAAVVWVSILCQWNYCIIFHLIQCFVFWFRLKVVWLHAVIKFW